jgi:hypothetical protein
VLGDATDATRRAVGLWHQAVTENGASGVVIIARENDTRDELNAAARELWGALGLLGEGRTYRGVTVAVGDRVICRQNDARLDVDNGMRGSVRELDSHLVVIETDAGAIRELPAAYADKHLEHAYALTGHAMQGGTVERAIVVASPRDLTAGWSYTALSRARGETRVLIVDADENERSEFAPGGSTVTRDPSLTRVARQMLERDDEDLAIEQWELGRRRDQSEAGAQRVEAPLAPRGRKRLEDLDARLSRLHIDRERVASSLEELATQRRRFGRSHDPSTIERAHLARALTAIERELEIAVKAQADATREVVGHDQPRVDCELRRPTVEEIVREATPGGTRLVEQDDARVAGRADFDRGIGL